MKKVCVIYDDTRKPNWDIRNITGKKGFGETIFKRLTLRERARQQIDKIDNVILFADANSDAINDIANDVAVILLYSDHIIRDEKGFAVLVEKSCYSHEPYKIVQDGRITSVIFENICEYKGSDTNGYDSYNEIKTDCFFDISEVNAFRQFITGGFEARFFNSLSGDEYTVVKSSDNVEKLKAEYMFYDLLPDDMKQWFVRPFNYREEEAKASYSMQRYHMTDLAIRYVHSAITIEEFEDILSKLFHFISHRSVREVSSAEYESVAKSLYIDKVLERAQKLKQSEGYDEIAGLIATLTDYKSIDDINNRYISIYNSIRNGKNFKNVAVVGHGDMCFSNILYSKEASLLLFIDPKGAVTEDELYMDPFYDLAKLSHSVCGHYDFFNSGLFEIAVDEQLKGRLKVEVDNRCYVEAFKQKLAENGIDFRLIRLYEASLFLSMLPLHMDRPKKVFAFILNAIAILDSLEEC